MRNVLLVAATRSGRPASRSSFAAGFSSSRACSSSVLERRRGRAGHPPAPPGRNRRVSRPAPSGTRQGDLRVLVHAAGQFEGAAADVEDQQPPGAPAEPPADGEERQPGLLLPRQHLQVDPGPLADPLQHLQAVLRLADRRGDQRQQLLAALLLRLVAGLLHRLEQGLLPRLRQQPVLADVLGQAQHPPVVVHRRGVRAAVGVDHQQVHRVGSDVENPEAHGPQSAGFRSARVAPMSGRPGTTA